MHSALKHTPKIRRTAPVGTHEVTFTPEQLAAIKHPKITVTWPPEELALFTELVRLKIHQIGLEIKRAKARLRYHNAKAAS
jgi:hypothetical protein